MNCPNCKKDLAAYATLFRLGLPPSIVREYEAGATLEGLAERHQSCLGSIRKALVSLGVAIRPQGRPGITGTQFPDRAAEMAALRRDGATFAVVGAAFGVTGERASQIIRGYSREAL